MKKSKFLLLFATFYFNISYCNQDSTNIYFTLDEYLSAVLKFHPIAKQADLIVRNAEAQKLKTQSLFEPVLTGTMDEKTFDGKNYWNQIYSEIKIPTWYGLQPKIGYELNTGAQNINNEFRYLNPERVNLPNGLLYAGFSANLMQGLIIDQRRNEIKQVKIEIDKSVNLKQLELNDLLFEAFLAYNSWLNEYFKLKTLENALNVSYERFKNVKRLAVLGEIQTIDTIETYTQIQQYELMFLKSISEYNSSRFYLNLFLWDSTANPIYLSSNILPQNFNISKIISDSSLFFSQNINELIDFHPKTMNKVFVNNQLIIEKKLKTNNLLPVVNFNYNYLISNPLNNPQVTNPYFTQNYKYGLEVKMPILLRKERAELRMVNIKMQDNQLDIVQIKNELGNKFNDYKQELLQLEKQLQILESLTNNLKILLEAEKVKFKNGESTIFIINSREIKYFETQIKLYETKEKYFKTLASLKWVLAQWN